MIPVATELQYQNFMIDRILPEKLRAAACRTYFLNIVHVAQVFNWFPTITNLSHPIGMDTPQVGPPSHGYHV